MPVPLPFFSWDWAMSTVPTLPSLHLPCEVRVCWGAAGDQNKDSEPAGWVMWSWRQTAEFLLLRSRLSPFFSHKVSYGVIFPRLAQNEKLRLTALEEETLSFTSSPLNWILSWFRPQTRTNAEGEEWWHQFLAFKTGTCKELNLASIHLSTHMFFSSWLVALWSLVR